MLKLLKFVAGPSPRPFGRPSRVKTEVEVFGVGTYRETCSKVNKVDGLHPRKQRHQGWTQKTKRWMRQLRKKWEKRQRDRA